MPAWFPRSVFGLVLAVLYVGFAIYVVNADRRHNGGGWITLNGLVSFIVTFPVSALGEAMGLKPDYKRNLDMAFAILICGGLVYLAGAGLGALAKLVFTTGGKG